MLRRILNTRTKLGIFIITMLMLALGLSYGTFTFVTQDYKASELLIANLVYGINITPTTSNVTVDSSDGKKVLAQEGVNTILVKITSLNPIDSKYQLEYKITEGTGTVKYAENTGWLPSGKINKNGGLVYEKVVKVVIEATSGSMTVEFNVSGGYTYNDKIVAMTEYTPVTEEYKGQLNKPNSTPLIDIVQEDNHCTTEPNCDYIGGSTINNYLQYPTDTTASNNLWRITGSSETGIKIVKNESLGSQTSVSNIKTNLENFYKTLDKTKDYVEPTNKFNCTETGCTNSDYTNIGLFTTYEYTKIGGNESYLNNQASWFALGEDGSVKNITPSGIEDGTGESGLRPSVYLQSDVSVTGSGTITDPYRLSTKGDIIIAQAMINNKPTTAFPSESDPYIVDKVECTNDVEGSWDSARRTIVLTKPNLATECTVYFKTGYTVQMTVADNAGTISTGGSSVTVGRLGKAEFIVTPDSDHQLKGMQVNCTSAKVNIDESSGKITLTEIDENQQCSVTLKEILKRNMYAAILEDNTNIGTRNDFSTVLTEEGGLYKETNTNYLETEGRKDGINAVYYFAGGGKEINNWVVFGGFWWRIIRTNEDGSVRLLYAGKATKEGETYIGHDKQEGIIDNGTSVKYNSSYADTRYVGYMYGETGETLADNRKNTTSSTIKTKVDSWFDENLDTETTKDNNGNKYSTYLSRTAIYCNDRSTQTYSTSGIMYYGAAMRLTKNASSYGGVSQNTQYHPSFKCGEKADGTVLWPNADNADKFTGSQKGTPVGNEALGDKPIALMTADEVAYAGGVYGSKNANAWYYQNSTGDSITGSTWWWTMSPYRYSGNANVFDVYGSGSYPGYLNNINVGGLYGVRPVVSLKSCVSVSGSGKTDDPYIPSVDGTCANADN